MCISRPQKVVAVMEGEALVESGDTRRIVMSPIPLRKGDYILSQNSVVVQKIPKERAEEMLEEWKQMNRMR